jgi:hypothetical protein
MNQWIEHVRAFAKARNLSYMCAATDPECRAAYKTGRPLKAPRGPANAKPASPATPTPVVRVGKAVRMRMPRPVQAIERSQPLTTGIMPNAQIASPVRNVAKKTSILTIARSRNAINPNRYPSMNKLD